MVDESLHEHEVEETLAALEDMDPADTAPHPAAPASGPGAKVAGPAAGMVDRMRDKLGDRPATRAPSGPGKREKARRPNSAYPSILNAAAAGTRPDRLAALHCPICGANGLEENCRGAREVSFVADVTEEKVLAEALDLLSSETAPALRRQQRGSVLTG